MKTQMKFAGRFLILAASFFAGCRTAHDVAVTSFRVIDAPASYVRRYIDEEPTAARFQSDEVTPGRPPSQGRVVSEHRPEPGSTAESGASRREASETKPSPSSQRAASNQSSKIPYAKPVPGKPGYVYSPFDPDGGYVDVTGYAAGSKVKDPYSGKIFIVP